MSSIIVLKQGDLLEYTRDMKGKSDLPNRMTVRAVVRGFEVTRSKQTGEMSVSVWLFEGSQQLGEPTEMDGKTVTEGIIDRKRELIALDLDYLLSLDPTVVRGGNSPRDLTNFEVGSNHER